MLPLFDVGFSGEHVEAGLPIDRLGVIPTLINQNEVSHGNDNNDAAAVKNQNSSKSLIRAEPKGYIRLVCLSLNMSHQTLKVQTSQFDGDIGGGGGGGPSAMDESRLSEWVCDNGIFEAVAVESLHEQADLVVISFQDAPTSQCV